MKYVCFYHSKTISRKCSSTKKLKSPLGVEALGLKKDNSYLKNFYTNKISKYFCV